MTRRTKTPRQRAEEALSVANRKVAKLTKRRGSLQGDLQAVERDLAAETKRRNYLATNPDLPRQTTTRQETKDS